MSVRSALVRFSLLVCACAARAQSPQPSGTTDEPETQFIEIAPPTVSYPSGTAFTANGTEQKPAVSPASADGYTVDWGTTDWKSAGTHTLTITLNEGYGWEGGSTDPIIYSYTFYTDYYYGRDDECWGFWWGTSRWYKNASRSEKWNANPDSYSARIFATIASLHLTSARPHGASLNVNNDTGYKAGTVISSGRFAVTYGPIHFQNTTATPVQLWETQNGLTRFTVLTPDLVGGGEGYFVLDAGATNQLQAFLAPESVSFRFSASGATRFYKASVRDEAE